MHSADAAAQLKSLKTQLAVLEARLSSLPADKTHTLAELGGMLRSEAETTADEIDAALFRLPERDGE